MKRKIQKVILLSLLVSIFFVTPVMANDPAPSSIWQIVDRGHFTWYQTPGSSLGCYEFPVGYGQVGSEMIFEGVATSPEEGQFELAFQKRPFSGMGLLRDIEADHTYVIEQHSRTTLNTRTGENVVGQYFRISITIDEPGGYRLVFQNPTNPQVLELTQIYQAIEFP